MSQQKDFTLQQLAQIALGGDSLGIVNISLLHTIINFALKKLNCENEKVTLIGRDAEILDKMLRNSSFKPGLFLNDKDIKSPMKAFDQTIKQLEEQVEMLECNLEKHLSKVTSNTQDPSQPCQMECEIEEQKDETISALLKNEFLLRQLKVHLSKPIICRMNKLDIKLKKLSHNIEEFKKNSLEGVKKVDKMDDLSEIFFSLRREVDAYVVYFNNTIEEIQQNMDLKLNNCEVVDFKSYFRNINDQLTKETENHLKMELKPRALIVGVEPFNKQKKRRSTKITFANRDLPKSGCNCDEFSRTYSYTAEEVDLGSIDLG